MVERGDWDACVHRLWQLRVDFVYLSANRERHSQSGLGTFCLKILSPKSKLMQKMQVPGRYLLKWQTSEPTREEKIDEASLGGNLSSSKVERQGK